MASPNSSGIQKRKKTGGSQALDHSDSDDGSPTPKRAREGDEPDIQKQYPTEVGDGTKSAQQDPGHGLAELSKDDPDVVVISKPKGTTKDDLDTDSTEHQVNKNRCMSCWCLLSDGREYHPHVQCYRTNRKQGLIDHKHCTYFCF